MRTLVPQALAEQIAAKGTRQRFSHDAIICQRNDEASGFWMVEEGKVRATRLDVEGNILLFDIITAGHIYGELAYFHKVRRQVDAFAIGNVALIWLSDKNVRALLESNIDFVRLLLETLAGQLNVAVNRFATARLQSPMGHMAQFLLDSSRANPKALRFTQQDLADAILVSRNTASTLLQQMQKMGVIDKGYGWIRILDINALQQLTRS